jgi:HSP20 family protein
MYLMDYDKLIDDWFSKDFSQNWVTGTKQFVHKSVATDIKEDLLKIGLAVPGHSNDTLSIEVEDNRIRVKSTLDKTDDRVFNSLALPVDETLNVGKDWDITKAEAECVNGILNILIPKKEESKPKKLTIKVG